MKYEVSIWYECLLINWISLVLYYSFKQTNKQVNNKRAFKWKFTEPKVRRFLCERLYIWLILLHAVESQSHTSGIAPNYPKFNSFSAHYNKFAASLIPPNYTVGFTFNSVSLLLISSITGNNISTMWHRSDFECTSQNVYCSFTAIAVLWCILFVI